MNGQAPLEPKEGEAYAELIPIIEQIGRNHAETMEILSGPLRLLRGWQRLLELRRESTRLFARFNTVTRAHLARRIEALEEQSNR
jgi:hypothetical protein